MPDVKELVQSPDYLAYKFDFNSEQFGFLPITRDDIRRVNSLDRQVVDPQRQLIPVPLKELLPLVDMADQSLAEKPPRFIFHTAFCSSTFLSRCLEVEGATVSLREPQLLLDAANAKRLKWRSGTTGLGYQDFPKLALLLLQKHAGPGEKLILKPINSVNNIASELMELSPSARSLMLFTDARNFVLSTLKKGEQSKYSVRAMFDLTRCDFPHLANLRLTDTIHMTDLKVILTLWRLQIAQAQQALQQYSPKNRMASIYGERLIEEPLQILLLANRYLDLGIPEEKITRIANSDSRFDDAKNAGQRFSIEKRNQAYQKIIDFYGSELDKGLQWMVQNNPGTRLRPKLAGTLN